MSFGKLQAQEEPPPDATPPQVLSATTFVDLDGRLTIRADIVDDVALGTTQTVTVFGDTLVLSLNDGLWEVSGIGLAPMPRGSYEIDLISVQDATGNGADYDYNDNPAIETIDIDDGSALETLGAALDNTTLEFSTSGDSDWQGWAGGEDMNHDGTDAAQSGPTRNDQQSALSTNVTGPGTLTFWWKVSSETGFDFLQLMVDDAVVGEISGTGNWEDVTVSIPSGNHTIDWVFIKDGSESEGTDCGWVDEVVFAPGAADPYTDWLATAGLSGTDADELAMPRGDGVPNLIKFGSNIPGDLPLTASNTVLQPNTGASGIPWVGLVTEGNVLAIEYLRRRDGAVTYAPQFSSDLKAWETAAGEETIQAIDSLWLRVTVKDAPPPGAKSRFGRVRFAKP